MKKKKILQIVCITIAILLLIPLLFFLVIASPWLIMAAYIYLSPSPTVPTIDHHEFPFTLTYMLDGEVFIAEDVYVCEFEGFSANEGTMRKERKWSGYVKSVGDEVLDFVILKEGNSHIVCIIGDPEYFMGDPDFNSTDYTPTPTIVAIEKPTKYGGYSSSANPEYHPILAEHQVSIISFEIADPIENEFVTDNKPIIILVAIIIVIVSIATINFFKPGKKTSKNS